MDPQFLGLLVAPPDPAFGLMAAFDADSHPKKVSLIAGAYHDEEGQPHRWLTHLIDLARSLTFGSDITNRLSSNVASLQTVSGTGANHLAAAFLSKQLQPKRVFIPGPTCRPRGNAILRRRYGRTERHHHPQPCAHNPTGMDLTKSQWIEVAELVKEKHLFPVFDSAYQGFATRDVDGDAWAIRYFSERILSDADSKFPGVCVAQSFSNNFGLYGERVGALHLVVPRGLSAEEAKSQLTLMARGEYWNPP
ncbi:uncharacterized protein CDV56_104285 [Aspergillus thermomutatus]|uniref:Aminotransferase class I/classII large domain-containing protein n=1 Tax=Aspergillus thermomutatus TaxID=41047 RepID=A0A397GGX1_ASPTH|nr:uncharacterized protein CDV56_104285 [Aspergillus thermomutatus]RHZ49389.1 hypothetical protein CDV56_104285 [Aspergillus thermomutatus]